MHLKIRKIVCLLLAAVFCLSGAAAFDSNVINSKFEYVLWQIEDNSLYTQKPEDCMPQAEICLLYTSPSPRDGLLSRMPSSA